MAWIDKKNKSVANFTATRQGEKLTMEGTNNAGRLVRNTFHNIQAESFDWVQEWTFDGGSSWVEVAKIHCKRKI